MLKTLYKKTSIGAIQYWQVRVIGTEIYVEFGQVGTKSPQKTIDVIKKGKNIGKINETTPEKQAELEAKSLYKKQVKKGYVPSIKDAEAGKVDSIIEGGISPMLAHNFDKYGHKIKYPGYVSRKLDGLRIVAVIKDGVCSLWSRTRKRVMSLPHVVTELEMLFSDQSIILDGEAYTHRFNKDFEMIASAVRKQEAGAGHELIEYHVFDVINESPFWERLAILNKIQETEIIKIVENHKVNSFDVAKKLMYTFMDEGYEGAMLRSFDSFYEHKRSYGLQKLKIMQDDEFSIVGISEGKGKLAGHVGSFICKTKDGQEFSVKLDGKLEMLKKYFENSKLWKGKKLTVKYQNLTAYGLPRFPVGVRIRED